MDRSALRDAIARELETNLLPFWREKSLDHRRGGFIAEMANDGTVRDDAPRGLILNARLLWTFSALFRELGDERDLALARRAFDVLEGRFRDREHGGYFWRIDAGGRPLDRSKKIYGQAFAIYALSEHLRATSEPAALDAADELVELIDRHARDRRFGGWIEARAADWSEAADLRLSDKDMDVAKSMNTHLHLLEAFTNLHRARPCRRDRGTARGAALPLRPAHPRPGRAPPAPPPLLRRAVGAPLRQLHLRPRHRGGLAAVRGGRGAR